ncbi:hypothetical protein LSAT2_001865 [Lamellibrachia satsuma]|nr:hypothetical protein LSAT2_001865 [Lamellibrachia satsuma]
MWPRPTRAEVNRRTVLKPTKSRVHVATTHSSRGESAHGPKACKLTSVLIRVKVHKVCVDAGSLALSRHTTMAILFISVILLSSLVRGTSGVIDEDPKEYCLMKCHFRFMMCIQQQCPTRTWPVPVSQRCLKERSECIADCTDKYKYLRR